MPAAGSAPETGPLVVVYSAFGQDAPALLIAIAARRGAIAPALSVVCLILGCCALRLLGRSFTGLLLCGAASQQKNRTEQNCDSHGPLCSPVVKMLLRSRQSSSVRPVLRRCQNMNSKGGDAENVAIIHPVAVNVTPHLHQMWRK
jgi:hypothetical protein